MKIKKSWLPSIVLAMFLVLTSVTVLSQENTLDIEENVDDNSIPTIANQEGINVSDATSFLSAINTATATIINLSANIIIDSISGDNAIYLAKKATTTGRIINGNGFSITYNGSAAGSSTSNFAFCISDYKNITLNNITLINSSKSQHTLSVYRSSGVVLNTVSIEKIHSDTYSGAAIINSASEMIIAGNLSITVPLKSWGGINLGGASTTYGSATIHFEAGSDFLYDVSDSNSQWPVPIYADGSSTTLYEVTSVSENLNIVRESMSGVKSYVYIPERTITVGNAEQFSAALVHPLVTKIVLSANIVTSTPVIFDATMSATTQSASQTKPTSKVFTRSLQVVGNGYTIKKQISVMRLRSMVDNAFTIASSNVTLTNIKLENSGDTTNVLAVMNASNIIIDNVTIEATQGTTGVGILLYSSSVTVHNTLKLVISQSASSAVYVDVNVEDQTYFAKLTFDDTSSLLFDGSNDTPIIDINPDALENIEIDATAAENVDITINNDGSITTDIPNSSYTVTFIIDTSINQTTVSHGDLIIKPEVPQKEGYTFIGWFKDASFIDEWNFNTLLHGHITLYAKWDTVDAKEPKITKQPEDTIVYLDENKLTVVAESLDGGELSYQWYQDGIEIFGATNSSYILDTVGEHTYYVSVTNTNTSVTGKKSATGVSDNVDVKVLQLYTILTDFSEFIGKGNPQARIEAPFDQFIRILLDEKEVSPTNYTVTSGSTIVTLKEEYVQTLANGTYDYTVEFINGTAKIKLVVNVVALEDVGTINPRSSSTQNTGDNTLIEAYLLIALLSIGSLIVVFKIYKKE